jgi:hypothetical protein
LEKGAHVSPLFIVFASKKPKKTPGISGMNVYVLISVNYLAATGTWQEKYENSLNFAFGLLWADRVFKRNVSRATKTTEKNSPHRG